MNENKMNSSPELAKEKIRRAKLAILSRNVGEPLRETIARDRDAFSGMRLLFASDVAGAPIQQHLNQSGVAAPLFCGRGMLAFSDTIEQEMLQGTANIAFAARAILDTNLLSDLPKFYSGESLRSRDKVTKTLKFVEDSLGRNIDWTFASLENLREVTKPNNQWPFLKVAAARYFDNVGLELAKDAADFQASLLSSYIELAEDQWRTWLANEECWKQVARRDLVYAILLFVTLERWRESSIENGMARLINFCLDRFNTVPLKELYFAWKALQTESDGKSTLAIFNEPQLMAPKKESLNRISALAWDLFLFRWCETLMTELKGNVFYVPTVTTLDEDLLNAIKACPLRAMLICDEYQVVESIFDDELEFQHCLNRSIEREAFQKISAPGRQSGGQAISRFRLSSTIYELEGEVQKMMS